MKLVRGILIVVLICSCIVLNISCTRSEKLNSYNENTIEVIVKMKDSDYWQTARLGAEAAGKEFGIDVTFDAPDNEGDIDTQIQMINDAISRKVNAIVLAACDYEKLVNVTEKAINAGIPVVIIDSALDSSKVSSFIATDNVEAGKMLGNQLLKIVGSKCNVAIMNFVKGSAPADQREAGFLQVIKNYPDINIVDKEYCSSDSKLAEELTKKILARHADINAIVAFNAPSAIGVGNTIEKLNLQNKIKIIGFDSFPEEVGMMEDNVIQATVVQNPYAMGYLGVKYALDVLNKKSVPKYVDTHSIEIDKNNMYTPENEKLIFPFVN